MIELRPTTHGLHQTWRAHSTKSGFASTQSSCPNVTGQLRSCPKVASGASANSRRVAPELLVNFGQLWRAADPARPNFVNVGQQLCQFGPDFGRVWPNSVTTTQQLPTWSCVGRLRPNLVANIDHLSNLVILRSNLAKHWPSTGPTRPDFAEFGPSLGSGAMFRAIVGAALVFLLMIGLSRGAAITRLLEIDRRAACARPDLERGPFGILSRSGIWCSWCRIVRDCRFGGFRLVVRTGVASEQTACLAQRRVHRRAAGYGQVGAGGSHNARRIGIDFWPWEPRRHGILRVGGSASPLLWWACSCLPTLAHSVREEVAQAGC